MADFEFEIEKTIGILSSTAKGWQKEVNMVSWGGKPAKLDIRDWSPDHQKMSKGISLSEEEVAKLKEVLAEL